MVRSELPLETQEHLATYTRQIADTTESDRKATAIGLWGRFAVRRRVRPGVLAALTGMAPGHQRCMYCGDSQGTDIDHFEPKSQAPLRTFDWTNYLLACSYCNSNQKRDLFPRSPGTAARSSSTPPSTTPCTTCDSCCRSVRTGASARRATPA